MAECEEKAGLRTEPVVLGTASDFFFNLNLSLHSFNF